MNIPDWAQDEPLLIEYSIGVFPIVVFVIVIVPSTLPQSVGSVDATFVIEGAFGVVNTTGLFA